LRCPPHRSRSPAPRVRRLRLRRALEEELPRTKPPATPTLDRAKALLEDFAKLWETEQDPAERRKLIAMLFEQIWQKDGLIVAVKPPDDL
jgi:hypothetical protein